MTGPALGLRGLGGSWREGPCPWEFGQQGSRSDREGQGYCKGESDLQSGRISAGGTVGWGVQIGSKGSGGVMPLPAMGPRLGSRGVIFLLGLLSGMRCEVG